MVSIARKNKIYSIADFMELPDQDRIKYELIEGRLHEMSPAGAEHANISSEILVRLRTYAKENSRSFRFLNATFNLPCNTKAAHTLESR